ncbi:MSMEG_0569 family flavin-dependent oxidoreductase [Ketobacter sp. MCCC 1A13808]|uniref:MSMEG_0569 family flavin-dependent oxidoreductase n=1 Tax=Ketobacter sp. MCCC 1A13808 TaxID=2602738 RepID=UPI000F23628D|nr:MSMEG_0569 family flavin-dependent oxidoreductase [Ketobacter sp. MCCC 1A13808]MVF11520.1 MSMEG_0569 family flavin-dependent oxidoreductase [Ketobacter sp. MCCC 1A13808]RLP53276.1 MAG: MSMEG_0569 family flavin-dependent oxidoreductase [Ketobacter sp.]
MKHYDVIIVGGGQAGLSVSYYCQKQQLTHLVLEKSTLMNAWQNKRWDSFTLVTPNWQCQLPDYPYSGDDPNGFMNRDQILQYLDGFRRKVNAPVREHCEVRKIQFNQTVYQVSCDVDTFTADQVVVASGSYQQPIIPDYAQRLPHHIQQLHSEQYKNPQQLNDGAVLVVGSGQSGSQIAEDLHLAGKHVFLAVGDAPRCARFYRGRDVVDWLTEMKYYDIPVDQHPLREGVRDNTNHYVTGRDGGRDIDLRRFALEGMELFGKLEGFDGERLHFSNNLNRVLDNADKTYNSINQRIDQYIDVSGAQATTASRYMPVWRCPRERGCLDLAQSGITSVIWSIGFRPDYQWLDVPVFNGKGYPQHARGVTTYPGLYFIGLPWLYTWGSGRFSGVDRDARYLVDVLSAGQLQARHSTLSA